MKINAEIIVFLFLLINITNLASLTHKYDTRSQIQKQNLIGQTITSTTTQPVYFKPYSRKEGLGVECKSSNKYSMIETWNGHNACVHLVHHNKTSNIQIYFDQNVDRSNVWEEWKYPYHHFQYTGNAQWLLKITSDVWLHMKETYGRFGLDPELHLVIHGDTKQISKPYRHFSQFLLDTTVEQTDENRNILDLSLSKEVSSLNGPTSADMDTLINELFPFFDNKFQGLLFEDSRNGMDWFESWRDIFTIDIYNSLAMYNDAERYVKNIQKRQNLNSTETNRWFTHWLYPIYKDYGASALRSYFGLLQAHTAIINTQYNYRLNLNIGEFVLFWSAAAETDLREFAHIAFRWNSNFEHQFVDAKLKFFNLTEMFNETDFNFTEKSITSTPLDIGEKPIKVKSKPEAKEVPMYFIIGGSVGGFIIVILVLGLIMSFIVYKRKIQDLQTEIRALTPDEVNEFFEGDANAKDENETQELVQYMPFVRDFEITRDQLTVVQDKIIGSGQFGRVMHGFLRNIDGIEVTPVAVKTVKANVEVVHFKAMLLEAKVMAYLGRHPNIVKLLGTYTANIKNREIFLALELCPLGDLHKFLKKNGHTYQDVFTTAMEPALESATRETNVDEYSALNQISILNLVTWAQEISSGMMYLTEKKVIHGDLAARNVLLTSNRIANISDFGLSRQLLNYANYKKQSEGPLPWRWMAVESLNDMKFSVASDVWAFGITLWEIFSLSKVPYPCWKWDYAFVDRLISGERLPKPQYANQKIYELMKDCWKIEPNERPTFHKINSVLGDVISFVGKAQVCQAKAADRKLEQN